MKLKIKIKRINDLVNFPKIIDKGEWIDLEAAETAIFAAPSMRRGTPFDFKLIPLGVAMKLPEGFEAHILPRSSTFKNFGIIMENSQGIVDNSYSSNEDEWKFPAVALQPTTVNIGDRICQFRIELSQKATLWQKLKWLFSSGIELVEVEDLGNEVRGGFGSTGV